MVVKRREELIPKSRQDAMWLRRSLRGIVAGALPLVAATALSVSCGTVVILGQDGTVLERGVEISREGVSEERRVSEEPTSTEVIADESFSPEVIAEDGGEIVVDASLQACPPYSSGWDDCGATKTGRMKAAIGANEPSPLPKARCMELCQENVYSTCGYPRNFGTENYEIRTSVTACEEGSGSERNIVCEYNLDKICAAVGRLPAGLTTRTLETICDDSDQGQAGRFFAEIAYMEAAAVTAFEYLVKELRAYNAPAWMIEWAEEGVQEEVEHAEMVGALASRYGCEVQSVEVEPFALRSLAEIAYDNAREGCVRETYGSLMAYWQASTAQDPAVRAVMERIAHEESRHSSLSWAIEAWILPQLSAEEQATYKQLQKASLERLQEELLEEPHPALVEIAGVPTVAQSQYLLAQLQTELQSLYAA
ncbi:MAG: ferritin-like domain-containing protein [Myxococcales bacterium]|nr:ferritin-like domain-containing protein [Myxococcales bacterium]MCB9641448.1 ferritin-like domain-containing protein [Myxococcales bacterium]